MIFCFCMNALIRLKGFDNKEKENNSKMLKILFFKTQKGLTNLMEIFEADY